MTDINVAFSGTDAALRVDLGGTTGGQYDVLTLTNGNLALDSDSRLNLYYVNGYTPSVNDSWTILNYGSITGSFDLPTRLTITGATGIAADPNNYTMTYNTNNAVLTLIPEPGSLTLVAASVLAFIAVRRRLRG